MGASWPAIVARVPGRGSEPFWLTSRCQIREAVVHDRGLNTPQILRRSVWGVGETSGLSVIRDPDKGDMAAFLSRFGSCSCPRFGQSSRCDRLLVALHLILAGGDVIVGGGPGRDRRVSEAGVDLTHLTFTVFFHPVEYCMQHEQSSIEFFSLKIDEIDR